MTNNLSVFSCAYVPSICYFTWSICLNLTFCFVFQIGCFLIIESWQCFTYFECQFLIRYVSSKSFPIYSMSSFSFFFLKFIFIFFNFFLVGHWSYFLSLFKNQLYFLETLSICRKIIKMVQKIPLYVSEPPVSSIINSLH